MREAAYNRNIAAVKQHIAAGADVDLKNKVCKTSFFIAVEYGKKGAVELFEKGAVVIATEECGRGYLNWSVRRVSLGD